MFLAGLILMLIAQGNGRAGENHYLSAESGKRGDLRRYRGGSRPDGRRFRLPAAALISYG